MLHQIFRHITSARYTRTLEAEVARVRAEIDRLCTEIARLRAENRALLNSILGIAGIPPILVPSSVSLPTKCHSESAAADDESRSTPPHSSLTAAEKNSTSSQSPRNDIPPNPSPESSSLRFSAPPSAHSSPSSAPSPPPTPRRQLATPLRRRSWHQITRTLELASAKKPSSTD